LFLVGLTFIIIGFIDFFASIANFNDPSKFWCLFVGLPLVGTSGGFVFSYIQTFLHLHHTKQAESEEHNEPTAYPTQCECGEINLSTYSFCKNCGKKLQ
jgi:hypothetical protein